MALVVHTADAGPFIAEAGLGEGPLDPLPLADGPVRSDRFDYMIERDGDGWWVAPGSGPRRASSTGLRAHPLERGGA